MAWFEKLKEGLEARYVFQSQVDPCVWYKKEMVILFCVDDCLIFSPSKDKLMKYMCLFRKIQDRR